jgi:hypothetical protein
MIEERIIHMKKACFILAILAIAASNPTCAKAKVSSPSDYKKHYLLGPNHRAFVTTNGVSPYSKIFFSWGWSNGYSSKKLAISEAMRQCKIFKRRDKTPGVCKVFAAK